MAVWIAPFSFAALSGCSDATVSEAGSELSSGGLVETSTSTGSAECPLQVEGDFIARSVAEAEGIASVTGQLTVTLSPEDVVTDLSFLNCLESADHLEIRGVPHLTTLDGMTSLTALSSLSIFDASSLTEINGTDWMQEMTLIRLGEADQLRTVRFPQLEHLTKLTISTGLRLEELDFPRLRTIGMFEIGPCAEEPLDVAAPSWTSLDGFPAIEEIGSFYVKGQYGLAHLDILDALLDNGGVISGNQANVVFNPMLPEAEVLAQLAPFDVKYQDVCGNLEGNQECSCGTAE